MTLLGWFQSQENVAIAVLGMTNLALVFAVVSQWRMARTERNECSARVDEAYGSLKKALNHRGDVMTVLSSLGEKIAHLSGALRA